MERIAESDINHVIEATEKFLLWLKKLKREQGNVVLNPNYTSLLVKVYNTPDIMMYRRG